MTAMRNHRWMVFICLLAVIPCIVVGRAFAAPPTQELVPNYVEGTIQACSHQADQHLLEACSAYVFNDAHLGLQPFLKAGNSSLVAMNLAKHRLNQRYSARAQAAIFGWITAQGHPLASWPNSVNVQVGPHIDVLEAHANLQCNKAVLVTKEFWYVIARDGTVLYEVSSSKSNQTYTVVLHRTKDPRFHLAGHYLHKWKVDNIYQGRKSVSLTC
jgi:hypothetical protein